MRSDIIPAAARIMLHAGVTSVRDLGTDIDNAFWLREEIASGRMPGPRAFIAGPFLRKTKTSFVSDDFVDTWVVESPADGRRKVQRLAELGVDLIKTQDEALSFEELEAIYDEAHKLGLPVATHLFSQKALRTALEAGLGSRDTIEHIGEGRQPAYPEDIVQMIIENDVYLAPTIIAEEGIRQIYLNPEFVDHPEWKRYVADDLYEDIVSSYDDVEQHPLFSRGVLGRAGKLSKLRQLHEAGAEFVVASDSGTRGNPHFAAMWREMFFLVHEVGMEEMEVITAATSKAARVLRRNDLGAIAEGKLADIIVIDGDPLMDIGSMKNVVHVIRDGAVFR
jgi:imidazolonepropionase-like amidohydrolase